MSIVVLAMAHVFFETHQGECRSTLGMRQGLSSRIEGGFPGRLVKSMFCGNQSVGFLRLNSYSPFVYLIGYMALVIRIMVI